MKNQLFVLFMLSLVCPGYASAQVDEQVAPEAAPYYDQLYADGKLDMTIALGFEQKHSDVDVPVIGPILDIFTSPARDNENTQQDVNLIDAKLLGCSECGLQAAGKATGLRLYTSEFKYRGKPVKVRIKFIYSEPGVSVNGLRKSFIDALGNDDVVLYVGHGRNGKGFPDFASPLGDSGKIFYNDPVQGWVGFEKGYFHPKKYQILALSACRTVKYFREALRTRVWEKDPSQLGLILSDDDSWFEDYPDVAVSLVHSLITTHGADEIVSDMSRVASFYKSKHLEDKKKIPLFVADGLFNTAYKSKPKPKRAEPKEPWTDFPF